MTNHSSAFMLASACAVSAIAGGAAHQRDGAGGTRASPHSLLHSVSAVTRSASETGLAHFGSAPACSGGGGGGGVVESRSGKADAASVSVAVPPLVGLCDGPAGLGASAGNFGTGGFFMGEGLDGLDVAKDAFTMAAAQSGRAGMASAAGGGGCRSTAPKSSVMK